MNERYGDFATIDLKDAALYKLLNGSLELGTILLAAAAYHIDVFVDHFPSLLCGESPQLWQLVLVVLSGSGNSAIEGYCFHPSISSRNDRLINDKIDQYGR